jgi:AraC-like DNA-binding protein
MTALPQRVPMRYLVLLLDHLRRHGFEVEPMLRAAGVEPRRLHERDATMAPAEVDALISALQRATGRGDLGFEQGRLIKMNSHDLLGYGLLSAGSVHEFLRLAARHYPLMTETFTLRYRRAGALGEALYTPTYAMPPQTLHYCCEVVALAHCNQIQLLLGGDMPAHDYHLAMPEPPHIARYRALAPLRFFFTPNTLPGVRVVMGPQILDRPLPLANPHVARDIDARCDALGRRPGAGITDWGELVAMLLRQAQGERVTLADVARRIGQSARTLDRRLKQEGLQFRELSQQVRFEQARELLATPGMTVAQAALRLGFSDAANFSRAFRRVVGVTPSRYQQDLAGAETPARP